MVNKTGYPVHLTEHLSPNCQELQLEAKQMRIKIVSTNCELQVLRPRKESGVCFRPIFTKVEVLKLKDVALLLRNISTVDNRRPGKKKH